MDGPTRKGEQSASLAVDDMPRCLQALVPILAQGIEKELRGGGGFDALGLLREAAGKLAETNYLWARIIPGLLPIEIVAIVHWARVEPQRAIDLVDNIEGWRDVPMHKAGARPIHRFRWKCMWSDISSLSMSFSLSIRGWPRRSHFPVERKSRCPSYWHIAAFWILRTCVKACLAWRFAERKVGFLKRLSSAW